MSRTSLLMITLCFLLQTHGLSQPEFSVSPASLGFGNVTIGSIELDSVTVTNIGSSLLSIGTIISDHSEFVPSPISVSIPPAANQTFYISFSPTSSGLKTASIVFVHDGSSSPDTLSVSGTGVISSFLVSPSINFGNLVVGSSKEDSVTVSNEGNLILHIDSVKSDQDEFSVSPTMDSIAPGEGKKFYITFYPTSVGLVTGHVLFHHDGSSSPDTVLVTGTGVTPGFSITPASLAFGNIPIMTTKQDSVLVTNNGTSILTITSVIANDGDYTVIPTTAALEPSEVQTFYIFFHPTLVGSHAGTVIFTHDASTSPTSVPVTGTGTATITVQKFRDRDGDVNTTIDQTPKQWHLSLYRTSVSVENLVVEGDVPELSAVVSEGGTYIACEADSGATWIRINGNHSRYDTMLVSNSDQLSRFINLKVNSILIRKFEDDDGSFATVADRVPRNWHLELRKNSMSGSLIATGEIATLQAPSLGDGQYFAVEADSVGWVSIGYILDGLPIASSAQTVSITISDGQSATIDFVNSPPIYSKLFRTFTPEGIAQKKPVKKKPVASRYSAQFINQTGTAVNGLQMVVKTGGSVSIVITIERSGQFPIASSQDGRVWNFSGATIPNGDTVVICGIGNRANPVTIASWNWIINGIAQAKQPGFTPPNQLLLLPMPNYANLRNDIFQQGGFGAWGLVVGIPQPDSLKKKFGWVRLRKSSSLLKSLVDRTGLHTQAAHGFDKFASGKSLVSEQKVLEPQKHNNRLFADLATLRFGIVASALGKTPIGLGELIYDDRTNNPLNGMMVKDIAHYADSLLMGYYDGGLHKFAILPLFITLDSTIQQINLAFNGPIDSQSFAVKLALKGTRRLVDVPYLHANPSVIPERIVLTDPAIVNETPARFRLYQNYPNPFNPSTVIQFELPSEALVTLRVYSILGQEVAVLLNREQRDEGLNEVEFNAQELSSGIYFYRIIGETIDSESDETGRMTFMDVKKMLLVK
ncbi:MAG: choice-of-anchor D domain-containing protein [Ignavibacteriales bacterium]|nr:choice-of-anchor D domain-containing protein [Ignavibacteriales bacterium]